MGRFNLGINEFRRAAILIIMVESEKYLFSRIKKSLYKRHNHLIDN